MKELVIATRNVGKSMELGKLFSLSNVKLLCLNDFPWIGDIEETGETLHENAFIKTKIVSILTGLPTIGDDSGMEIYALNMFPGIYSARCAGNGATDETRRQFILDKMENISDRRVRFRCVLCFIRKDIEPQYFEGITNGKLLKEARGSCKPGLPYDSIFFHKELNKTFAEATQGEKGSVSHRGRAAKEAKKWLEKNL